jgi:hypothetical protein
MHYRNGREAKNGDKIVQIATDGKIENFVILYDAAPGNDYCNGMVAYVPKTSHSGACLCDCLHVDDLAEILKEKGLHNRPTGK